MPAKKPTTALDASIATAKGKPVLGTFDFEGQTFSVLRKPPALLLAELARTNTDDPESVAVLAEFFEVTLGKDEYRRFKKAMYASDSEDEILLDVMAEVIEVATGRPTESSRN